jgi:hypothetical protein
MFYGTAGNTGQLYVKINNTQVSYTDDAANIARSEWQNWAIDLTQVGGNLQNVTSLTIGVDGANAAGMLYFDEIGLYPKAAEYITPVDPGTANLVGHWKFDEGSGTTAADASGNGYNGTLNNTGWIDGKIGSALGFDAINSSYVDIPAAVWSHIDTQVSLAFWVYIDSGTLPQNNFIVSAYSDPANNDARVFSAHLPWGTTVYFDTSGPGYDRTSQAITTGELANAWIHWAFVKNADTGEVQIYRNGTLWHSASGLSKPLDGAAVTSFTIGTKSSLAEGWFTGQIDDVQLYNKALTQEEALWVAGRTSPMVKPF